MVTASTIRLYQEWIARRKARLDQRQKEFEDQYSACCPHLNLFRMDWLEVEKFRIEISEWELEQTIKEWEENETESG